jgi:hypothetical protein
MVRKYDEASIRNSVRFYGEALRMGDDHSVKSSIEL